MKILIWQGLPSLCMTGGNGESSGDQDSIQPRRLDCTQELMDLFTGYICEHHTVEIHTNHVFLKLKEAWKETQWITKTWIIFFEPCAKNRYYSYTHMFRHTRSAYLIRRMGAGDASSAQAIKTFIRRWIPMSIHQKRKWRRHSESIRKPENAFHGKGG